MPEINHEEKALILFSPHIEEYCIGRWMNIEPEDRISEAKVQFCHAYRHFPIGSGHFWDDYIKLLTLYMDALNRVTPSLRFMRHLSLDRPYCGTHARNAVTLSDYLPDRTIDETAYCVDAFKASLPQQCRNILAALEQGIAKTVVARATGLSVYQLNALLIRLGRQYISAMWFENPAVRRAHKKPNPT